MNCLIISIRWPNNHKEKKKYKVRISNDFNYLLKYYQNMILISIYYP